MKFHLHKKHTLAGALGALVIGALLMPCTGVQAQQKTPVGDTWECIVGGTYDKGIAYITFHEDRTFEGMSIIASKRRSGGSSTDLRGIGGDSRGDNTSGTDNTSGANNTAASVAVTQSIFGFGPVNGRWNFDATGKRVMGFFHQVVQDGDSEEDAFVNTITFRALVSTKSLTLVATSANGRKSMYRGVRMPTLPDLSGAWYAKQRGGGEQFVEFFDLAPTGQYGLYTMTGEGAAYTTDGWAMVSARKRIAFATLDSNGTLRATFGTLNPRTGKAITSGIQDLGFNVNFSAYRYPQLD